MDEKEVARWTRCPNVVDPLTLTQPSAETEAVEESR